MVNYLLALVIFKASNRETGLLWIPKLHIKKQCKNGLENYNLGDWLRINMAMTRCIGIERGGAVQNPYPTRIFATQGCEFSEVRVPLVFFSDNVLNKVVAYSPEFGRIGTFILLPNAVMDKFCYAWIAYMALCRNPDLLMVLHQFNVEWHISELERPMTLRELNVEDLEGRCQFSIGIVVSRHEEQEVLTIGDGASQHTPKLWTAISIWTPHLSDTKMPGICIHRIDKGLETRKESFAIGTICKFIPVQNFSYSYTAVSPFVLKPLAGIETLQDQTSLKLKISHGQYQLDLDPMALRIHVPKLLGPIDCPNKLMEIIRRVHPGPYLILGLDGHSWKVEAIGFCGSSAPITQTGSQSNPILKPSNGFGQPPAIKTKWSAPKSEASPIADGEQVPANKENCPISKVASSSCSSNAMLLDEVFDPPNLTGKDLDGAIEGGKKA